MNLDELMVSAIRSLSIDMVENANTGHLGMPLGSAPMTYELYKNHLNVNPKNPEWFNRDRLVYSAGHGTPLVYSMLHLFGYDLSIQDLKEFRSLGSKTPGHPEYNVTPGVDASTGPLGVGVATAVGLAISEAHLAKKYNKKDLPLINHYTYVIAGDGCLMEGVANEAFSLAGSLGLSKLILLYDSNDVCSDGMVTDSTIDDVEEKFTALGWNYLKVSDGNNLKEINDAISRAKTSNKPTIIESKNIIGFGSTKQGTNKIHSDSVGEIEAKHMKDSYKWMINEPFALPEEIKEYRREYLKLSQEKEDEWNKILCKYKELYPKEYSELFEIDKKIDKFNIEEMGRFESPIATRGASGKSLNFIFDKLGILMGGSADLGSSNKTILANSSFIRKDDFSGNNINFGVREFAMGAIINGITLHGGLRGYCATFLVFLDYMKASIRMAALMKINPIFVFTHDSIIVGPDGPTHQPVEQLLSLRATPDVDVIRPADPNETMYSWEYALKNDKPTVLVLGRQDVEILSGTSIENLKKGAYVIDDTDDYMGTIIATGSEVHLSIKAKELLEKDGIKVRVVNMPSWELFDKMEKEYRDHVLDRTKPVLSVEASSEIGWCKYSDSQVYNNEYGDSGNGQKLYEERGFTPENVAEKFKKLLSDM
ncbi:transketolase [Helcococcus kunzii]|uniref:transketolase n=1 Tax=Helcococcus kunzii TaxID=40091 RepID=UPI001C98ACC2|nr:transketolase [Helcococcus kunzii]MCT1796869.1 transketolase [Helcococcus kunzii]MCT1989699.1 transketolase [Helcococcus kunzii]QZO76227.1 transketolase [Helcococcus kunzii]